MTVKEQMELVYHIRQTYGTHAAAVVQVSLELTKEKWTEADTVKYGTWIADEIQK